MDIWDIMTSHLSEKWRDENGVTMAKRVDMKHAKFLVVLRGTYRVMACELDGTVWLSNKNFVNRSEAYLSIDTKTINIQGWKPLGPFRRS